MNISVIIPSLNPDDKLIKVVDSLVEYDFNDRINFNVSKDSDKGMIYGFEAVFSF